MYEIFSATGLQKNISKFLKLDKIGNKKLLPPLPTLPTKVILELNNLISGIKITYIETIIFLFS